MKMLKKFTIVLLLSGACGLQAAHAPLELAQPKGNELTEGKQPFYELGEGSFHSAPMTDRLRGKISNLAKRKGEDPRATYDRLIKDQENEHYAHLEYDFSAKAQPLGNIIEREFQILSEVERPTLDQIVRALDMQMQHRGANPMSLDSALGSIKRHDITEAINASMRRTDERIALNKEREELASREAARVRAEQEAAAQRAVPAARVKTQGELMDEAMVEYYARVNGR